MSRLPTRTVVTWESTFFNSTTPLSYFINPNCFGDDAAKWLIRRLQVAGLEADARPDQEDFGWYFRFAAGENRYLVIVGYQPGDSAHESGRWVGLIEPAARWRALFKKGDLRAGATAVHEALREAPEARDVQWYFKDEFDGGATAGSPTP